MYFCKICGRQLEKKGDICTDCYEGLIEEEENKNDLKVLYTIKAQYKLGYELLKTPFTFLLIAILLIFSIIVSFQNNLLTGIFNLIVYSTFVVLYFVINKIRIESRTIELYKYKLVYNRRFHFKNHYEVRYKDIEEVQYENLDKKSSILSESSWWLFKVNQKYNMTDLFFKMKSSDKSFFATGFFIKPIHNFKEEVMPKLISIMGFVENTEKKSSFEEMFNIKSENKDNKNNKTTTKTENKKKTNSTNKNINKKHNKRKI